MATDLSGALARIETGQAKLRTGQETLVNLLQGHGDLLRTIVERLGLILEKLYPEATDGPTLQELLAEMVVRLGEQSVLLHRIDRRTESMAASLPADVVRAITGASGANGNGHTNGRAPS